MERNRKNLKITSIVLLIFAGSSVLNILGEVLFGELNNATESASLVLAAKIILLVVSGLCLLPQVYVGLKGLKIAKTPDASRAHIFWATVLLVFAVIGLISPALALLRGASVGQNVGGILSQLIEICLYYEYLTFAKAIAKAN